RLLADGWVAASRADGPLPRRVGVVRVGAVGEGGEGAGLGFERAEEVALDAGDVAGVEGGVLVGAGRGGHGGSWRGARAAQRPAACWKASRRSWACRVRAWSGPRLVRRAS